MYQEEAMDTQITVREIAPLTAKELESPTMDQLLADHRAEVQRGLIAMGFEEITWPDNGIEALTQREGRPACICFAPLPERALSIRALSEQQCTYCDERYPEHDVYYACLLVNPQEPSLHLLGPVRVRHGRQWQTRNLEQSQFLPQRLRATMDRYSPIFGDCVLYKMDQMLIPHVLRHGELPKFSVQGVFEDAEQGETDYMALMCTAPPAHLMLIRKNHATGKHEFCRPFFFYGDSPEAELELTRLSSEAPECGMVEMLDKTGRMIHAECLEAALYGSRLLTGKHYMWTLSLVADRIRHLQREFSVTSGILYEQAKHEYIREHGKEPPAGFAAHISTDALRFFRQEEHKSYAELCGRVTRVESSEVDSQPTLILTLQPDPQNEQLEVQIFAGVGSGLRNKPEVGDVVECSGYLYASPDAAVQTAESWQDSGDVAAMQEKRELEEHALAIYERYVGYSLALATAASTFAKAHYSFVESPLSHTRGEASLLVQDPQGNKRLLFVDTVINNSKAEFHYTDEQISDILKRKRADHGENLTAHRCTVKLARHPEGERYAVELSISPDCPDVNPSQSIIEASQQAPITRTPLTEARACRIVCNAICTQQWTEFAGCTCEDMSYESLVNGTRTTGKIEHIRYMAERKLLWEKQQGWPGMSMDTGHITYEGQRRPCFTISCYGRIIGVAVISVRHGLISDIKTLPPEINESFEPDAECSTLPRIYHPLRGHLTPHPAQQTPLQRFATACLQKCMLYKTGFRTAVKDQEDALISHGSTPTPHAPGARWVKVTRDEPSFCDLAFTHGSKTYAVCAIEVSQHPAHGGSLEEIIKHVPMREKLLAMAEKHRLIPCVFPAARGFTPDLESSWNLWDIRTLKPVIPENDDNSENVPPSDWEIICTALGELDRRITAKGGRMLGFHDTSDLLPHFWFTDTRGQLCWVIIRPHQNAMHADRAPSDEEKSALTLTPEAMGYVTDAYAINKDGEPAKRGDKLYIKLSELLPLD